MHFVAHGIENKPIDVIAFALFAAGLARLGVRVLRMRDDEWEAELVKVAPRTLRKRTRPEETVS